MQILKDLLDSPELREPLLGPDPEADDYNPPRVFFSDYNADSLNIYVSYWYRPAEWWDYLEHAERFNLALFRKYAEAGIEFAFPTQTLYLKQDSPLAADARLAEGKGKT